MNENTAKKVYTIPNSITVDFTWSPSKEADSRLGRVTLDLTDLDAEDVEAYMVDSLVIKHQGQLRRKHGTDKWEVPRTVTEKSPDGTENVIELYTVKVSKPGERAATSPEKRMAKEVAKMATEGGFTLEQLKALAELVKAGVTSEEIKLEAGEMKSGATSEETNE